MQIYYKLRMAIATYSAPRCSNLPPEKPLTPDPSIAADRPKTKEASIWSKISKISKNSNKILYIRSTSDTFEKSWELDITLPTAAHLQKVSESTDNISTLFCIMKKKKIKKPKRFSRDDTQ